MFDMNFSYDDTICAPATIPGTGAISIIRISGSDALQVADKVLTSAGGKLSSAPGYSLHYCSVHDGENLLDDVVVSVFRSPRSYTGEDSVEISAHASAYIVSRILDLLCKAGCRMAGPGEFTRRAFINGKMDLTQAEAVADLIESSSEAAHHVAMNQLKGGVSNELRQMRIQLLEITSLMELELDFSEEDVEFADRSKLSALVDSTMDRCHTLSESFHLGNAIKNGVPVAIVGAPNSGKSTLLNALLSDDRAIVSPIAGTTRDTIEEKIVMDGVLFRLIDTAGIRECGDEIEKMGIERALKELSRAQVAVAVLDLSKPAAELDSELVMIRSSLDPSRQKLYILGNKADIALGPYPCDFTLSLKSDPSSIDALKARLSADFRYDTTSGATLVTNHRHYQALCDALDSLKRVRTALDTSIPTDLIAQDLRQCQDALGSITGEISSQEVLNNIFSKHCIGK